MTIPARQTGIAHQNRWMERQTEPNPVGWLPPDPPEAVTAAAAARNRITKQLTDTAEQATHAAQQVADLERQQARARVEAIADGIDYQLPDPDPLEDAQQVAQYADRQVRDLAAARDIAEQRLIGTLRYEAPAWRDKAAVSLGQARKDYDQALTTLTAAAERLSKALAADVWLQAWSELGRAANGQPRTLPDPQPLLDAVGQWATELQAVHPSGVVTVGVPR